MATLRTNLATVEAQDRTLKDRCLASRGLSLELAAPLSPEDQCAQAMPDASPTKWHLAHTTWFYETFVLKPHLTGYRVYNESYHYCFNSYYEAEGPRHPRPSRGLLTRPSAADVCKYRAHVDEALSTLFARGQTDSNPELAALIELGINHEQQHQELLLTDILALFAASPLYPAYKAPAPATRLPGHTQPLTWTAYDKGIRTIGSNRDGFHFDCETPRHDVLVHPYKLANRLVTNGEWMEFMSDNGYARPEFWLSDGWATVKAEQWQAPGYWVERDSTWRQMTLNGLQPVDPDAPVSYVSYFEADAFTSWAGKRLPTEQEWESAAGSVAARGNTLGTGNLRPRPCEQSDDGQPAQLFGDVWEWTASPYTPYPGFRTADGAVGEYNGKFMCGQFVLRGASCVTPDDHSRSTYRNFFYPHQRWQFMGLRLAEDH